MGGRGGGQKEEPEAKFWLQIMSFSACKKKKCIGLNEKASEGLVFLISVWLESPCCSSLPGASSLHTFFGDQGRKWELQFNNSDKSASLHLCCKRKYVTTSHACDDGAGAV